MPNHQEMICIDCRMYRRSPQLEMTAESDHFLCRAVNDHFSIAYSNVQAGSHVTRFCCYYALVVAGTFSSDVRVL